MWRYEFDDHGGYDGLAGAFEIYDTSIVDEDGFEKFICCVDQYDYDNDALDDHEPWPEVEAIAKLIVDSVNEKLGK